MECRTNTFIKHLASPPTSPTRAPRMRQPHRRKKHVKSAMIGGAWKGRGACAGWGRMGWVRKLTMHTHLACPPAYPTRAPRMHKQRRRKEQGLSAMIGSEGWTKGARAGWGRRECAHLPCTLTSSASSLPSCPSHARSPDAPTI